MSRPVIDKEAARSKIQAALASGHDAAVGNGEAKRKAEGTVERETGKRLKRTPESRNDEEAEVRVGRAWRPTTSYLFAERTFLTDM